MMVTHVDNSINFFDLYESEKLPIVVYGVGNNYSKYINRIPKVSLVCDKKRNGEVHEGYLVHQICDMADVGDKIYVVVTVADIGTYAEISKDLETVQAEILLVHACNNVAFAYDFWSTSKKYRVIDNNKPIKVNIVCGDDGWIFKKFADRLAENLSSENVDVSLGRDSREDVDINHHIPYISFPPYKNDTLMITHVDTMAKFRWLKEQLETAALGICMSKDTMDKLTMYGISRDKLCYINPAHDGVIKPHKYLIGITHKCHDSEDLRKRATALLDVVQNIDSRYFKFFIMGGGWNKIIQELYKLGFEVDYYDDFDYETYVCKMQEIDYFLYMGFDEGTMGYLDAMSAGAGTIVTPQGYHIDTSAGIDYACNTIDEFHDALIDLQQRRMKRVKSVQNWTWKNYAKKHLQVWRYLLKREPLEKLYQEQHKYNDGIFSMFVDDNRI